MSTDSTEDCAPSVAYSLTLADPTAVTAAPTAGYCPSREAAIKMAQRRANLEGVAYRLAIKDEHRSTVIHPQKRGPQWNVCIVNNCESPAGYILLPDASLLMVEVTSATGDDTFTTECDDPLVALQRFFVNRANAQLCQGEAHFTAEEYERDASNGFVAQLKARAASDAGKFAASLHPDCRTSSKE